MQIFPLTIELFSMRLVVTKNSKQQQQQNSNSLKALKSFNWELIYLFKNKSFRIYV